MARPASSGPLGLRLALAFVGVALAAVAVLAGLTAAYVAADVSHLVRQQQQHLTHAVAVAAGAAWNRGDSWTGADLSPVLDLAARVGADVQVRDTGGRVVRVSPGFAGLPTTHERRETVISGGREPGQVIVRFSNGGLGGADESLRSDCGARSPERPAGGAAGPAGIAGGVAADHLAGGAADPGGQGDGRRRPLRARRGGARAPRSCGTWPRPSTRWPNRWRARSRYGATWSRTSRTSCARRWPSCRPATRPCWTGWPSRPPSSSGRCATRCCGWPAWSMTCSGWPPRRRLRCS